MIIRFRKFNLLCFVLVLLLVAASLRSQAQSTKPTVAGYVKDSLLQKPLAFVTVGIYTPQALAQPLKTTYTNEKGWFQLTGMDTGTYTLIISHTGFAEHQVPVQLSATPVELNINLAATPNTLQGVTVTARKPLIQQSDDKIAYNVENDPASKTQTAIDILRKTPFVSVDGEGNIQVNGQSNFKVLLNGRETAMFATNVKEALKGFPGATISRIEVITSPSAKYDAEGVGGIINIITKKKMVGYNGSVSAYYSSTNWYNGNTNFSAKFGKFGFSLNYGVNGVTKAKGSTFSQTLPLTPTTFTSRTFEGSRQNAQLWNWGNAELNWEIDSLNTVSLYGDINGGWNKSKLRQTITTAFPSSTPTVSYYNLDNRNEYPSTSMGADYIRKYSKHAEKEWSVRFNAENGISNTFLNSVQDNSSGTDDRYIINDSRSKNKQYTLQTDYILPLGGTQKLESGVKMVLRQARSDFESQLKAHESDAYVLNTENTDNFTYDQAVYSAYGSYSYKLKGVSLRLGGRIEQTEIEGNFALAKTRIQQSYTSLLPNIQVSNKFSNAYTAVLSYNMRLQRPYITSLNPFVNNNDPLNISYGNPNLDVQTIHNISWQNRLMKNGTFYGLNLSGSYSNNMIVSYASFDKATGITTTTSDNIGREYQLSLNPNITTKFNKDWTFSINGSVRYNYIKNKLDATQANSGISGNANMNSSYKITSKFSISTYAGFWRQPVTFQRTNSLNHWYGLNFNFKVLHEKLELTANAANFFNKEWKYKNTVKSPSFLTTSYATMPFRGITLGASWNFGKLKESVSKKKGVSNDDLLKGGN